VCARFYMYPYFSHPIVINQKLAGTGNSGVPGQWFIQLVAQEIKQVQSKTAMLDEPAV
jgi:hypothetical protein